MNVPHPWLPRVVDVSLLRIGSLAVAAVPGEFTTMASRRLTRAVSEAVGGAWGPGLTVVLAGLSGTYSSYVTTPEEYGVRGRRRVASGARRRWGDAFAAPKAQRKEGRNALHTLASTTQDKPLKTIQANQPPTSEMPNQPATTPGAAL
jgi:hypothetical protein